VQTVTTIAAIAGAVAVELARAHPFAPQTQARLLVTLSSTAGAAHAVAAELAAFLAIAAYALALIAVQRAAIARIAERLFHAVELADLVAIAAGTASLHGVAVALTARVALLIRAAKPAALLLATRGALLHLGVPGTTAAAPAESVSTKPALLPLLAVHAAQHGFAAGRLASIRPVVATQGVLSTVGIISVVALTIGTLVSSVQTCAALGDTGQIRVLAHLAFKVSDGGRLGGCDRLRGGRIGLSRGHDVGGSRRGLQRKMRERRRSRWGGGGRRRLSLLFSHGGRTGAQLRRDVGGGGRRSRGG